MQQYNALTYRGVRYDEVQAITGQQSFVFVDEIEGELESGERVRANVLTAEGLDEREIEGDAGVVVFRRIRIFQVVDRGTREQSTLRD